MVNDLDHVEDLPMDQSSIHGHLRFMNMQFPMDFVEDAFDFYNLFFSASKFDCETAIEHQNSENFNSKNVKLIDDLLWDKDVLASSEIFGYDDPYMLKNPNCSPLSQEERLSAYHSNVKKMKNVISLQDWVLRVFLVKLMNEGVLVWKENSDDPLNLVIPLKMVVNLCIGANRRLN